MPNFRDMQNEALQFGQRTDLDALGKRVAALEAQVRALTATVQELIQKIENPPDPQQQ